MEEIRFDKEGNIVSPQFQSIGEVADILQSARPWTRADYLHQMIELVRETEDRCALVHLVKVYSVIGASGQGKRWEELLALNDEKVEVGEILRDFSRNLDQIEKSL